MPFFLESTDAFVIFSNTWTLYFTELENLNFCNFLGCANLPSIAFLPLPKLSNFNTSSISRQISVTKIQIFKLRKIKGSYVWGNGKCINTFWRKVTFSHLQKLGRGANNGFSMAEFLWETPYLPTSLSDFIVELLIENLISL